MEELKVGLALKAKDLQMSDKQAQKLLKMFDDSGDGALQIDEFKGVEYVLMLS